MSAYAANSVLCILVIDGDVDAAQRLGERLESLGHEVDFAYGSAAGLDAARRLRPDAVFVDVAHGRDFAVRLRAECSRHELFLVAFAEAPQAGFDGHIQKTAECDALARLLASRHEHSAR